MPIGITRDHLGLSATLRDWAIDLGGPAAVREAENDPSAAFAKVWQAVREMGLNTMAIDERSGGGGGELLDQLVGLEAAAYGLVPGPLLGSVLVGLVAGVGDGEPAAVVLDGAVDVESGGARGELKVVMDVVDAQRLLAPTSDGSWVLVDREGWTAEPVLGIDLTRRHGRVSVDAASGQVQVITVDSARVRSLLIALAAAEASGIAHWCLDTAVAYAKVREQFGVPIGSFQAIKHLCAEMLERTESIAAVAWDASVAADQAGFASDVAATVAFDAAVSVAQDCIQVLGGIGFTFEHDAHLYLRRAVALRSAVAAFTGGSDLAAMDLCRRAAGGERRRIVIDFESADAEVRAEARRQLGAIAGLPESEQRAALAGSGYFMPHWPRPYGLAAGPVEQLVVDEEMARAGLTRPDIAIGAWALPTIIEHGTDEQRDRFVLPTLRGEITWCQLFSEPEAGSDLASLATRATPTDGGWMLTGQKVWTSRAREADWAICLARTDREAQRHRGITYFLLDMKASGIDTRPLREMTGDALFNEVFLDDVFVPDDCVVGAVNDGWSFARTTLANERVAMAGIKLGVSTERAVELAPESVRVGQQVALATLCQLLGVRATLRSIAGQGPGAESSVAKLLGVRNRQEASELVVELLGPRALLSDPDVAADVHEMLLTRCLSIAGGTTQILRNVVGERLLGLPRS